MRDIIKQLTITRLEIRHRMEEKYLLELNELGTRAKSTLSLTVEDMIRFGLDPGEDLVGTTLEVGLKAIPYARETASPDTVLIARLVRSSEVQQHYSTIPPTKSERRTCRLEARTPVNGGSLVILPSTYYELNLLLTEGEFRRLKSLPEGDALDVQLRHIDRHFRDVVLTYRGTLDNPRVFPQNYTSRMSSLAHAMIAYFDGDVDVVGHYCGLEIEEERKRAGDEQRLETRGFASRTWRREYFAVNSFEPNNWETPFADSVAQVDAILKERYDNRLSIDTIQKFYDDVEISTWESKKSHPIEELSVGLYAGNVFREHCYLPSIVIEARSVAGNRKACQVACEKLSQEAASLFGVRFDSLSLSVEEVMSEPEAPGKPRHGEQVSKEQDEECGFSSSKI